MKATQILISFLLMNGMLCGMASDTGSAAEEYAALVKMIRELQRDLAAAMDDFSRQETLIAGLQDRAGLLVGENKRLNRELERCMEENRELRTRTSRYED